jgi:predicted NUDIX family phosphoesterase
MRDGITMTKDLLEAILYDALEAREAHEVDSDKWHEYTAIKTKALEKLKPSTKENILYYYSEDIKDMPMGFSASMELPNASLYNGTRSSLEYNSGLTRHIIPYCVVKCGDEYYFTVRKGGSSETRLVGKIGCLGGHVGKEGIDAGMMRELQEESDLTDNKIKSMRMKGFLKSDGDVKDPLDVDKDHLGLIYVIELRKKNIREEEEDKLKGIWIHKDTLLEYYDKMESWTRMLFDAGVIV